MASHCQVSVAYSKAPPPTLYEEMITPEERSDDQALD